MAKLRFLNPADVDEAAFFSKNNCMMNRNMVKLLNIFTRQRLQKFKRDNELMNSVSEELKNEHVQ
jgi:hypothetical protein